MNGSVARRAGQRLLFSLVVSVNEAEVTDTNTGLLCFFTKMTEIGRLTSAASVNLFLPWSLPENGTEIRSF